MTKEEILKAFNIEAINPGAYAKGWLAPEHAKELVSIDPATGGPIASVRQADAATYESRSQRCARLTPRPTSA
jgi:hypothetical protein